MKLSLQIHSLHSIDEWIVLARAAEEAGLDEIHIAERIDFPYPTWPTLFLMAEHTDRIVLGPGVTNPYSRHPALTAKMVAMLDRYSGGRAVLGIGQGDFWQFEQLGISHDRPLQSLREAVQLIRHFLAGNAFDGEIFSVAANYPFPWKAVRDDLQIFVGSRSPGGMAVAGEVGDELHLPNCVAAEFVALAHEQLHEGTKRAGRDEDAVSLAASPQLGLSYDRTAAVQYAQELIGRFIEWMELPCRLIGVSTEEAARLSQAYRDEEYDYLHANVTLKYLQAFATAGTPVDVIEGLERLADLGIEHVTFNEPGPNLYEAITLLGKEIVPHFTGKT